MRVIETRLPGVILIEPDVHRDARGFFLESYHAEHYAQAGIPLRFVQDNHSSSIRNTLRGLHWQWRRPQGKLVRAVRGTVFDVAVDLRPDAPTFGQWYGVELSADRFCQIYIPPHFAHGFCALSDLAEIEYKCTDYYDPGGESGLIWNDPDVAIAWPITEPILSPRDQRHPTLRALFHAHHRLRPAAAPSEARER